ncbi:MAG: hypothetical protein R3F62_09925 [Planctomycetota bacterium]
MGRDRTKVKRSPELGRGDRLGESWCSAPLRPLAGVLVAALACAAGAQAQQLGPVLRKGQPVPLVKLKGAEAASAAAPETPTVVAEAAPAAAQGPSPLLQAYLKLGFDRRPGAILAARAADPAALDSSVPAPVNTADPAWIASQSARLARAVTLGDYDRVRELLAALPTSEVTPAHQHLLQTLAKGHAPPRPPNMPEPPSLAESNRIGVEDLAGLIDASPSEPAPETVLLLAPLVKQALKQGHDLRQLVARFLRGTRWLGGADPARRHEVGRVLLAAEQPDAVEPFLPAPALAVGAPDPRDLRLLVETYEARYRAAGTRALLEAAWAANLVLLGRGDLEPELRYAATVRAVDLAARLEQDQGQAWIAACFAGDPERGVELLAAVGRSAADAREALAKEPEQRLRALRLQQGAVEALLEQNPTRADAWQATLDLLAQNWLTEAEYSAELSQGEGEVGGWRYDRYGNLYFPQEARRDPRAPDPIDPLDLLERAPGPRWRARIAPSLLPRFVAACARLALKGPEEDAALGWIEALAPLDPETGHALAEEFVTRWTQRHDPNSVQRQRNPYISIWGFQQRLAGIPLTRTKQAQNLKELAQWAARLRALPIEPVEQALLAQAFMRAHSQAEVYRLDALEQVFGGVEGLEPETLAALVQAMRQNLASVWRDPKLQEQHQTKRKDKEIQAQVLEGYAQAGALLERGLSHAPDDWRLLLARATVRHDHNVYLRYDVAQSTDFSAARKAAFEEFAAAAAAYARAVPTLEEDARSVEVYERWLYASLGASDLEKVDPQHTPDPKQPPRIRAALEALDPDARAWHEERLASDLFTRMGGVNPGVKSAYLRAGFAVIGEHPAAREAKAVLEYYGDLVHEIQLQAEVDGSDRVGHSEPFGVLVSIRHTEHIERESGGFGKYLQNQNSQRYAYNYGRPLEDYRDKFEEAARVALSEQFDVRSLTFAEPDVESRGDPEPGWRVTPYCYLLLQARGPEVDTLPALSLDLDFIDTSGYVVLPVASPRVPLDARDPRGDPRPVRELELVQTLDERQAGQGRLVLEVRAQGLGLVPALSDVLTLDAPGFEVLKVDDQQVSAAELDVAGDEVAVRSERSWTVELRGADAQAQLPERFVFGEPRIPGTEATYQRYVDADLEQVPATVELEAEYGTEATPWAAIALFVLIVGGLVIGGTVWVRSGASEVQAAPSYPPPTDPTPFSALAYLAALRAEVPFAEAELQELEAARAELERAHFGREAAGDAPDLEAVLARWSARAEAAARG